MACCGSATTAIRGECMRSERTASSIAELRLPVRVLDVEEVTLGPGPEDGADYLYVGDIGDNDSRRFEITVVRFKEPAAGSWKARSRSSKRNSFGWRIPMVRTTRRRCLSIRSRRCSTS